MIGKNSFEESQNRKRTSVSWRQRLLLTYSRRDIVSDDSLDTLRTSLVIFLINAYVYFKLYLRAKLRWNGILTTKKSKACSATSHPPYMECDSFSVSKKTNVTTFWVNIWCTKTSEFSGRESILCKGTAIVTHFSAHEPPKVVCELVHSCSCIIDHSYVIKNNEPVIPSRCAHKCAMIQACNTVSIRSTIYKALATQ